MNLRAATLLLASLAAPHAAWPGVQQSGPDGFLIEHKFHIGASPAVAWQVLVHPERWWPKDHTWSGDPTNLSLTPQAGGCFCERWDGGSSEHGRIVQVRDERLLRFVGALGPLQDLAVTGVLTVTLAPDGGGTAAVVTYRVSGDPSHRLEGFVKVVDAVLAQQFGGFVALASAPLR
jgi:uncharacterized protein YndB with AHSA1/START domain